MLCDEVDDETLHLILQIQLHDLDIVKQRSKGKNRQDEICDAYLAVKAYKSELKSRILFVLDRCMCKSMAKANQLDGLVNEELLGKLRSLYVSTDDDVLEQAESSTWAVSRGQTTDIAKEVEREKRQCNSCLCNYIPTNLARYPYSYEYCRDCLLKLFETSLTDESLFPLRCYKQLIPVNSDWQFLSSTLVREFQAKATYCHKLTYLIFILKEFIKADIAVCQQCKYRTCAMCKGAEHKDQDCAQDSLNQDQRCFSCRRIVELEHGCNHMTCCCGVQFCYLCGHRWKNCTCVMWNEERLYARPNAIMNRDANFPFTNPQRIRIIRRDPISLHGTAQKVETQTGTSHCRECHDLMPLYINECPRCHIRACRRRLRNGI
ncbi:hypothetical protein LZ30DRAFT_754177 [Colletotrichum cereale]|nr:hypothetical protein LZ30DRAFT_754177 [Colletotrichum cereale]